MCIYVRAKNIQQINGMQNQRIAVRLLANFRVQDENEEWTQLIGSGVKMLFKKLLLDFRYFTPDAFLLL